MSRLMGQSECGLKTTLSHLCFKEARPFISVCTWLTRATWLWIPVKDCLLIMCLILNAEWFMTQKIIQIAVICDLAAFSNRDCPVREGPRGKPCDGFCEWPRLTVTLRGIMMSWTAFCDTEAPHQEFVQNRFAAVLIQKAEEGTGSEHLQCSQSHLAAANKHEGK